LIMRVRKGELVLLMAWLGMAPVWAQTASTPATAAPASAAPAPASGSRMPTRVTIDSDDLEWVDDYAIYTGHVFLTAGAMQLRGDRMEIRQVSDRQFEARVTGAPAHLHHDGTTLGRDGEVLPVDGTSRELTYDSRQQLITLTGDVVLQRGRDEIRGENIRYDIAQRRIQAVGPQNGQVRIVIEPPPELEKSMEDHNVTTVPQEKTPEEKPR